MSRGSEGRRGALRLRTTLVLLGALWVGCGRPPREAAHPARSLEDYPGTLAAPSELPGDFVWRQRVTSRYQDDERSFDVVVEKIGPKLAVVGLSPFGSPAFALTQSGQTLRLRKMIDRELPFSPRAVLVDINRAFFQVAPSARPEGWHETTQGAETLRERWSEGRLRERRFTRRGGPKGVIVVRYEGGMLGLAPPAVVHLDNGWYGYSLRVETLSVKRL